MAHVVSETKSEDMLIRAYGAFGDYVRRYDRSDPKITLKISHIFRVAKVAKRLAETEEATAEQANLAAIIGLLHDIGRFEQIKVFKTFKDSDSIDHGSLGRDILLANDRAVLRSFVKDAQFDDVIAYAVEQHNKAAIDEEAAPAPVALSLFHAKIVRDADKIDNFKTSWDEDNATLYGRDDISSDLLSPKVIDSFFEKFDLVDYANVADSAADKLVSLLSYMHDCNFAFSYHETLEQGYIKRFRNIHFNDPYTESGFHDALEDTIALCEAEGDINARLGRRGETVSVL